MQVSFITFKDPNDIGSFFRKMDATYMNLLEIVEWGVPQLNSLGYWVPGQFLAGNTGSLEGDQRSLVSYFGSFNWHQQPVVVRGIRLSDKITFEWQGIESLPDFLSIRKSSPSFVNPDPTLFAVSPARQVTAITAPPNPLPPGWPESQEAIYLQQVTDYQDSINTGQYPKGSVLNLGDIAEAMFIADKLVTYYPVVMINPNS